MPLPGDDASPEIYQNKGVVEDQWRIVNSSLKNRRFFYKISLKKHIFFAKFQTKISNIGRLTYFPGIDKFNLVDKFVFGLDLWNGLLGMVSYENSDTATLVLFLKRSQFNKLLFLLFMDIIIL